MLRNGRTDLAGWFTRLDRALDRAAVRALSGRLGWRVGVVPYIGRGARGEVELRGRVLLRRDVDPAARPAKHRLRDGLAPYLSVEVAGAAVAVEVAGRSTEAVSDDDGYLTVTVPAPDLAPGWHPTRWHLAGDPGSAEDGTVLVVDPSATFGMVSDLDDTVIHTGLTRFWEALRTSLATAEHERVPIPGAAELYQELVELHGGRAPLFYVSSGAWNLHAALERFLDRHGFPDGPLAMTDWGPGTTQLFREDSTTHKVRTVLDLLADHPAVRWVLVGDSGQQDPEAYAAVARVAPERLHAIYIREVPPYSDRRAREVRAIAAELNAIGVPLLLIRDSVAAAEHAQALGLLDPQQVQRVRAAVTA